MNKLLILLLILFMFLIKSKSNFSNTNCINLPNIDKIFVLSLKESTKRRQNFTDSYNKLNINIPLEIIWGIDTKIPKNAEPYRSLVDPYKFSIMYDLDNGTRLRQSISDFNSGALGCYLGHLDFYKNSFKQNLKYSIICEDNVILENNFLNELNEIKVPSDFDIIFFHCWRNISEDSNCNNIKSIKRIMGTKCYLINVNNMKKYYKFFYPINNHIDDKYKDLVKQGCKIYYYPLESIKVDSVISTIGHADGEKDIDYFLIED